MLRIHRTSLCALALITAAACDGNNPSTDGGTPIDAPMTADSGSDAGTPSGARGRDNPPTIGTQIDRNGRPAISTATVSTFTPDENRAMRRGAYTSAAPATWSSFEAEIAATIAILDSLDTVCGNQLLAGAEVTEDRYAALAGVLADDRLWVNAASGNNSGNLYLGVEAEALGVLEDGGAGGRRPTDDVVERSYSVLAAGALTGVDDTITADEAGASNTAFPFLGAPE